MEIYLPSSNLNLNSIIYTGCVTELNINIAQLCIYDRIRSTNRPSPIGNQRDGVSNSSIAIAWTKFHRLILSLRLWRYQKKNLIQTEKNSFIDNSSSTMQKSPDCNLKLRSQRSSAAIPSTPCTLARQQISYRLCFYFIQCCCSRVWIYMKTHWKFQSYITKQERERPRD